MPIALPNPGAPARGWNGRPLSTGMMWYFKDARHPPRSKGFRDRGGCAIAVDHGVDGMSQIMRAPAHHGLALRCPAGNRPGRRWACEDHRRRRHPARHRHQRLWLSARCGRGRTSHVAGWPAAAGVVRVLELLEEEMRLAKGLLAAKRSPNSALIICAARLRCANRTSSAASRC